MVAICQKIPGERGTGFPTAAQEAADAARAPIDNAYIIARLQEINRTLLPDFPGRTPSPDSIAMARSQVMALIGDVKGVR